MNQWAQLIFLFFSLTSIICSSNPTSPPKMVISLGVSETSSILSLTLTNPLDDPILVLKWRTPMVFDHGGTFKVKDLTTNLEIPYEGRIINHTHPVDEDFVVFGPQETKTFQIDLADSFSFEEGHEYQISIESDLPARAVRLTDEWTEQLKLLAHTFAALQAHQFSLSLSRTTTTFIWNGERRGGRALRQDGCEVGFESCESNSDFCCPTDTYCGKDARFANDNYCFPVPKYHILLYIAGDNDYAGYGWNEAMKLYGQEYDPADLAVTILLDLDPTSFASQTGLGEPSHEWEIWTTNVFGTWDKYFFGRDEIDMTSSDRLLWFLNFAYSINPKAEYRILILEGYAGPIGFATDNNQCPPLRRGLNAARSTQLGIRPLNIYPDELTGVASARPDDTRPANCEDPMIVERINVAVRESKIDRFDVIAVNGPNFMTMTNLFWMSNIANYLMASQTFTYGGQPDSNGRIVEEYGYGFGAVFEPNFLNQNGPVDLCIRIAKDTRDLVADYDFNIFIFRTYRETKMKKGLKKTLKWIYNNANGIELATRCRREVQKQYLYDITIDLDEWATCLFGTPGNPLRYHIDKARVFGTWTRQTGPSGGLSEWYPSVNLFLATSSIVGYNYQRENKYWWRYLLFVFNASPYPRPVYSDPYPAISAATEGFFFNISYSSNVDSTTKAALYVGTRITEAPAIRIISQTLASVVSNEYSAVWDQRVHYVSFSGDPTNRVEVFYRERPLSGNYYEVAIPFVVTNALGAFSINWILLFEKQSPGTPDVIISSSFVSWDVGTGISSQFTPIPGSTFFPVYLVWFDSAITADPDWQFYYFSYLSLPFNGEPILDYLDVDSMEYQSGNLSSTDIRINVCSTTYRGESITSEMSYNASNSMFTTSRPSNVIPDSDVPTTAVSDVPRYTVKVSEDNGKENGPPILEGGTAVVHS